VKRSIAVIGASPDRSKYGNRAVRAYLRQGWDVFPVHPKAAEIEGLTAYHSVVDVPLPSLDRISIYLPPEIGLSLLPEIARKPAGEIWLNPGSESDAVIAKGQELGLPIIVGCSIVDVGVNPHQMD
jgi:uncharacterized protein